jgi:hypothetical protein
MVDKYHIFEVFLKDYQSSEAESLGTKEKFWFKHQNITYLYKKSRPNTIEDCSEKIAAELSVLMGLPHAGCELAMFEDRNGIVSRSFISENYRLVHGNEILANICLDYQKNKHLPSQHTLTNIFKAIRDFSVKSPLDGKLPNGIVQAIDVFIGYLILDALIGNSDRHHENWGYISNGDKNYLAPNYDLASSLGRELQDSEREARLKTKDKGYSIEAYAKKCTSCIYELENGKPAKVFDLVSSLAHTYPDVTKIWLLKLAEITDNDISVILQRLPDDRISPTASEFALGMLKINKGRLLGLSNSL